MLKKLRAWIELPDHLAQPEIADPVIVEKKAAPVRLCRVIRVQHFDGQRAEYHECKGHDLKAAMAHPQVRMFSETTHPR